MIFSDVFKIITNMDIFNIKSFPKIKTNLKSYHCWKIQESKKRVKLVSKKSTQETITNDDINEKPSQHERMKKNIIYFFKKKIREKKRVTWASPRVRPCIPRRITLLVFPNPPMTIWRRRKVAKYFWIILDFFWDILKKPHRRPSSGERYRRPH